MLGCCLRLVWRFGLRFGYFALGFCWVVGLVGCTIDSAWLGGFGFGGGRGLVCCVVYGFGLQALCGWWFSLGWADLLVGGC